MQDFVHLHVHSEFSLLDGHGRIDALVNRALDMGQTALALTDHGTMYGTIPFYKACKSAGIKPIIGMEGYLAARRMTDRGPEDRRSSHTLLLAQNQTGMSNLFKIASAAQLEGFYYKPRVDREFLFAHNEGLITTTGCMAGEIPRAIQNGNIQLAEDLVQQYLDVFGRERFYVEFQEHDIPELTAMNYVLLDIMKKYQLRPLATNDVHYANPDDGISHDLLLCIQTSSKLNAQKRMRMHGAMDYFLQTSNEMEAKFGHIEGALANSLVIAEMCNIDLDPNGYHLPHFPVPDGYDAETYLRHLCQEGLGRKYGREVDENPAVQERLDYELSIIHQMGFDTYFLIVWDMCRFSAENGIWWNVRGSGAGSVVAYSLNITDVEPLSNGLVFERFLNPHRVSMPDIDLDYPDDDRHRMARYIMEKYGEDKVAQIITFGTMGARAAVRDVGRAMDMDLAQVDAVTKLMPPAMQKPKIDKVLREGSDQFSPELFQLYTTNPAIKTLLDNARGIEGMVRHASTHAAGVIISDRPLVEYVPLHRPTTGTDGLGGIDRVTQWPMEVVEPQGLLKVDLLGLSTLTIMREAARLIERRHGVKYTQENIPYDAHHVGPDPNKTASGLFDLLGSGDTIGVFQVESAGMQQLMAQMQPKTLHHITAAVALYRPGPMNNIPSYIARMHGAEPVEYHHPALEPILKDTYGIIVYQEQIMQIASELAGYDPGQADLMRRAVSKKKEKEIAKHRQIFVDGCLKNDIPRDAAEKIYGDIEFFARYGFNRAHATDYAKVCCQTAFLKAHYPIEYMAAMLSVERNKSEKVIKYVAEARRMGYTIAPPAINTSEREFTIEDSGEQRVIRFGLGAIKQVGDGPIATLLSEQAANGDFVDLVNLARRVDLKSMGKRPLEAMIKAGVFDCWGTRPQLLGAIKNIATYSGNHHTAASTGQMGLFGRMESDDTILLPTDVPQMTDQEILQFERELLGMYVSEHPLESWMSTAGTRATSDISKIETQAGQNVTLCALVTEVKKHITKKQQTMAFIRLQDMMGEVDAVLLPDAWEDYQFIVYEDAMVVVSGDVQERNGRLSFRIMEATPISEYASLPTPRKLVVIAADGYTANAALAERINQQTEPVAPDPEPETAVSPPPAEEPSAVIEKPLFAPRFSFQEVAGEIQTVEFRVNRGHYWKDVARMILHDIAPSHAGESPVLIRFDGCLPMYFEGVRVAYTTELVGAAERVYSITDVVPVAG